MCLQAQERLQLTWSRGARLERGLQRGPPGQGGRAHHGSPGPHLPRRAACNVRILVPMDHLVERIQLSAFSMPAAGTSGTRLPGRNCEQTLDIAPMRCS